jgi:hypothetical protein
MRNLYVKETLFLKEKADCGIMYESLGQDFFGGIARHADDPDCMHPARGLIRFSLLVT